MELRAADGATVAAAAADAVAVVDTEAADAAVAADADASCLRQLHMGTEDHIFIIWTKFIEMSVLHNPPATHPGYQITCWPPENMPN